MNRRKNKIKAIVAIAVTLAFMMPVSIVSVADGSWSTTEVVSTESTDNSYVSSLMVDGDGTVHVAWHDHTDYSGSGIDSDIFYKYKPNGGSWSTTEASGTPSQGSHAWDELGTYEIKAKANDTNGLESGWSDPHIITIAIPGEPLLDIDTISGGLFKVSATIKNTGFANASNVNWSIKLDGGFILLGKETSGRILCIPAGDEATVSSNLILGLGKTLITVTAECAEGSSDTKEQAAFVLLFFIKI